jgi:hypothetical protein
VIDRQMAEAGFTPTWAIKYTGSAERRVRLKLEEFFAGRAVELHHRPALCNRQRMLFKSGPPAYLPDANDPDCLIYLLAGSGEEHDVETRVRGLRGQHSDLALARKRRRAERKKTRRKTRWASRPLRSRGFDKRKRRLRRRVK